MSSIVNTYEPSKESPPDILEAAINLQKTIVNNGGSIRVRVLPETLALTLIEEFSKSGATIKDTDVPYLEEFVDFFKTITVKDIEAFINIIKSQPKLGATYDISEQAGGGIFNLRTFIKFSIITYVLAIPSLAEMDEVTALNLKRGEAELQQKYDFHNANLSEQREAASQQKYHNFQERCEDSRVADDGTIIGYLTQMTCAATRNVGVTGGFFEMLYETILTRGGKLFGLFAVIWVFGPAMLRFLTSVKPAANSLSGLASGTLDLAVAKFITPLNTKIGTELLIANSSNNYNRIVLEIKSKGIMELNRKKEIIYINLQNELRQHNQTIRPEQAEYIEKMFKDLNKRLLQTIGSSGDDPNTSKDGITQRVLHMEQLRANDNPAAIESIERMIEATIVQGVEVISREANNSISRDEMGLGRLSQPQYSPSSAFQPYGAQSMITTYHGPLHLTKYEGRRGGKAIKRRGKGNKTRGKVSKTRGKVSKTRGNVSKTRGNVSKTRGNVSKTRGNVSKTRSKKRKVRKTRGKVKVSKTNSKVSKSRANSKY